MKESYMQTGFIRLVWQRLFTLMVFNFLFIICSIPIISIPSSITALHFVCQKSLLEESKLYTKFFRSFKQNFISSLPIGLVFVAGPALIIYSCLFYLSYWKGSIVFVILTIFCLIGFFVFFYVGSFAFAMLARVELSFKQIVRNSFILAFNKSKSAFGWIFLASIMFVLLLILFPYSTVAIILLGISLPCFMISRGILPIIDSYIVKK